MFILLGSYYGNFSHLRGLLIMKGNKRGSQHLLLNLFKIWCSMGGAQVGQMKGCCSLVLGDSNDGDDDDDDDDDDDIVVCC